ncbi:helix-turn-helix domain-containing protein [Solwaraspora sp. WMMD791]|uniref:nSTAND1 domain-containing NTPase n=1 Tax=Solwaraspora sp. WMMD791 TaxID=3016086 RepID=UPI00249C372F|nr:helix-turn-helix domain-containing protein [Solwaraspora sp. WMMD791]WFE26752.1 helix-turn-helix domain-containing protein [Solwaraspora sp. WMMD791]
MADRRRQPDPSDPYPSSSVGRSERFIDPAAIDTRRDFARELTRLRVAAGVTVRQVAGRVGVRGAHSTVGDWFAGRGLPSLASGELFNAVLAACGVSDHELVEQWNAAWHRVRQEPGRRPDGPTPYRGLAAYRSEDADWFHGRAHLTAALVAEVHSALDAGGGIVVVVGASGAGKSSLLQAGLVPALRSQPDDTTRTTGPLLLTPTAEPVQTLREQLQRTGRPAPGTVVIIDQFEEALTTAAAAQQQFVGMLAELATGADAMVVVLGVRADFYASLLRFPQLVEAVRTRQVTVGPMSESELREAIVEPARRSGVDVDDALVELLLREVSPENRTSTGAHDPGVLPLLSHALHATWQYERGKQLTVESYRRAGTLDGALAATADEVYQSLDPRQKRLARRLLLNLVQVSIDAADTRRRMTIRAFEAIFEASELADGRAVLDRFVSQRLVTVDAETLTITHEALLTAWPTLQDWIDNDRADLIIGQRLDAAAANWQAEARDPATLYRGVKLTAAQDWAEQHAPDVSPLTREFINASSVHARRRTRALYQVVAALIVLTLTTATLAVYAFDQRSRAESRSREAVRQRNEAMSRLIAGRADRVRDSDPALAMQLSLAAYEIAETVEARSSLLDAAVTPEVARSHAFVAAAQAVAISPDERLLAAVGADGAVRLWDATVRPPALMDDVPVAQSPSALYSVAFSPDGKLLAAAGADKVIHLLQASAATHRFRSVGEIVGPESTIYSLAFSPDGRTLAAGGADRLIHRWTVADPERPVVLPELHGSADTVQSVAWHPLGTMLAAAGGDGAVRLWRIDGGAAATPLGPFPSGHAGRITAVAFSPDGQRIASASTDKSAQVWRLAHPDPPVLERVLTGHTSWVNTVAFGPDGRTVATGSSDRTLNLHDLSSGAVTATLPHPAPVTGVAMGHDGHSLVTSGIDGVVRFWRYPGPVLRGAADTIFNLAVAGPLLASASRDGTVSLWDIEQVRQPEPVGTPLRSQTPHEELAATVAVSPDGTLLAAATRAGAVRLWDISEPAAPRLFDRALEGPEALVQALAFTADGAVLAAGGDDGDIHLWSVADPARAHPAGTIEGNTAIVLSLATSPDSTLLAATTTDADVRMFDISDPRHPVPTGRALTGFTGYAQSVAFSPDGRRIAAGSADRTIRIWDLSEPGRPTPVGSPVTGPVGGVLAVVFSPDGHTLAAASIDGAVWLWALDEPGPPRPVAVLNRATDAVNAVTFTSDGRGLAAAGTDGTIRLWDVEPARVASWICSAAGDPLTEAEWRQYVPDLHYDPPC